MDFDFLDRGFRHWFSEHSHALQIMNLLHNLNLGRRPRRMIGFTGLCRGSHGSQRSRADQSVSSFLAAGRTPLKREWQPTNGPGKLENCIRRKWPHNQFLARNIR